MSNLVTKCFASAGLASQPRTTHHFWTFSQRLSSFPPAQLCLPQSTLKLSRGLSFSPACSSLQALASALSHSKALSPLAGWQGGETWKEVSGSCLSQSASHTPTATRGLVTPVSPDAFHIFPQELGWLIPCPSPEPAGGMRSPVTHRATPKAQAAHLPSGLE